MAAILLTDNLFSPIHYPEVTLSTNEEGAGTEADLISTLRREDHWSPTTLNAAAWAKAGHTRLRGFDMVCLWVHNLLGMAYKLEASDDDFGTIQTVVDVTIPSHPGAGDVDDALGVVTEDLMWLKRFSFRAARAVRHYVPAMGADLKPELNGIVGPSVAFDRNLGDLPDARTLQAQERRSPRGVVGRSELDRARNGSLPIQFPSSSAYEQFRFHLFRYETSPGVLIFDEDRAEQAMLVHRPLGRVAFRQGRDYFYPAGELHFQEHDPL